LLYTYILDFDQANLCFKGGIESDLQTPRSQEVGIGMTCLLAKKAFGVPWDQLGGLPGPGLRFDYQGQFDGLNMIFESKGTSYRSNQNSQIKHGLDKKQAHHDRGDYFDVELVVSTFVGRDNEQPRIIVADPDFDALARIHAQTDKRLFRLRHYARVLQFVGLPKSSFALSRYARAYFRGKRAIGETILREKEADGYLDTEYFGNRRYFGRWFEHVAPEGSARYPEERYGEELLKRLDGDTRRRVFQGIRDDVYHAGFDGEPFAHNLMTDDEIRAELESIDGPVSLFPDGTIQAFRQP
jgi:hypothetical protein